MLLPEAIYDVEIASVESQISKSDRHMWVFKFRWIGTDRFLWDYYLDPEPDSPTLWKWAELLGGEPGDVFELDPMDLVGRKYKAVVQHENFNGTKHARMMILARMTDDA